LFADDLIFFFTGSTGAFGPWPVIFSFMIILQMIGLLGTSDQPVARSLPKHRTTQTQNKHIHIPNIHAFCRIRTHDPGFRASEGSTCLRPLGYRDRRWLYIWEFPDGHI
jgi:hypothetical protein